MDYKINNKKRISRVLVSAVIILAVVSVTLSLLFPDFLLHTQANLQDKTVNDVDGKYYSAADSLLAKSNSNRLVLNEKLLMITNGIESSIELVNSDDRHTTEKEMLRTAWSKLVDMEHSHLYPTMKSDKMSNYTYQAKCWRVTDNTFKKYTVYFWTFELESKKNNESHSIYILEDGTIFSACMTSRDENEIDLENVYRANKVVDYTTNIDLRYYDDVINEAVNEGVYTVEITTDNNEKTVKTYMDVNGNELTAEDIIMKDVVKYPGFNVGGLKMTALFQYSNGIDQYRLAQAKSSEKYMYAIVPFEN